MLNITKKDRINTRARAIQVEARAMADEYERESEAAYAEGLSMQYCIHGTNLWTDYDPMCGACESGNDEAYYRDMPMDDAVVQARAEYDRDCATVEAMVYERKRRDANIHDMVAELGKEDAMTLLLDWAVRGSSVHHMSDGALERKRVALADRWGI